MVVLLCATFLVSTAMANPQLALIPGSRANMKLTEPWTVRGTKFPYDHEVVVALPASYEAAQDRSFPVLWVLDSPLMLRTGSPGSAAA